MQEFNIVIDEATIALFETLKIEFNAQNYAAVLGQSLAIAKTFVDVAGDEGIVHVRGAAEAGGVYLDLRR